MIEGMAFLIIQQYLTGYLAKYIGLLEARTITLLISITIYIYFLKHTNQLLNFKRIDRKYLVLAIFGIVLSQIAVPIQQTTNQQIILERIGQTNIILLGLDVCVLGPIWEEIIFRYLMIKKGIEKWKMTLYIIGSATLFALMHMPGNLHEGIVYFLPGIIFGYTYVKTNIETTMSAHILFNTLVFVSMLMK